MTKEGLLYIVQFCPFDKIYWATIKYIELLKNISLFLHSTQKQHRKVGEIIKWVSIMLLTTDRCFSSTSAIIICGAPNAHADNTVIISIGPAPITNIFVLGPTKAQQQAWTPTLSGSHMEPSSRLTFFGNLKHKSIGWTICNSKPDNKKLLFVWNYE